jgi:hypothetical protein
MNGMNLFGLIIRKIFDWLLEIPPDLLGRKIERVLDRLAEQRQRTRRRKGRRRRRD